jgi:hypothetical protein
MFIIAHRGNLQGARTSGGGIFGENSMPAIENAIFQHNLYAEIDVWLHEGEIWGGHDGPHHNIHDVFNNKYLASRIFFHAKTPETLHYLIKHCTDPLGDYYNMYGDIFFHGADQVALTAKKLLWTYPDRALTPRSIAVMPEFFRDQDAKDAIFNGKITHIAGVCTDYPLKIRSNFVEN